jgi:hypothetical protein
MTISSVPFSALRFVGPASFGVTAVLAAMLSAPGGAKACTPGRPYLGGRTLRVGDAPPANVQPIVEYQGFLADNGSASGVAGATIDRHVELRQGTNVVPAAFERAGTSVRIIPNAPLVAGATYDVADPWTLPCHEAECAVGVAKVFGSFVPTDARDVTPPTFAGLSSLSLRPTSSANGSCDPPHAFVAVFAWQPSTDPDATTLEHYNLYRRGEAGLVKQAGMIAGTTYAGIMTCAAGGAPAGLLPGAYLVRAVDRAGNEDANTKEIVLADACAGPAADAGDSAPSSDGGAIDVPSDALGDDVGGKDGCTYAGASESSTSTAALATAISLVGLLLISRRSIRS